MQVRREFDRTGVVGVLPTLPVGRKLSHGHCREGARTVQMLRLIGTRTSHFTRKIRILLRELEIDFEWQLVPNLLEADAAAYGRNPLMQVPTLIDGDTWIIESDHIARYIVETRAPHDPLNVLALTTADLRQLAVLNGIMGHEAQILMAALSGTDSLRDDYFQKLRAAIASSLSWLEGVIDITREGFSYIDVATVCMWDHHLHFSLAPGAESFPRIAERVTRFAGRPSVRLTTPTASVIPRGQ